MTNIKIKQHIEDFPHFDEFAKIAQKVGFSEDRTNELYSTYRFALEADFQSQLTKSINVSKAKVLT